MQASSTASDKRKSFFENIIVPGAFMLGSAVAGFGRLIMYYWSQAKKGGKAVWIALTDTFLAAELGLSRSQIIRLRNRMVAANIIQTRRVGRYCHVQCVLDPADWHADALRVPDSALEFGDDELPITVYPAISDDEAEQLADQNPVVAEAVEVVADAFGEAPTKELTGAVVRWSCDHAREAGQDDATPSLITLARRARGYQRKGRLKLTALDFVLHMAHKWRDIPTPAMAVWLAARRKEEAQQRQADKAAIAAHEERQARQSEAEPAQQRAEWSQEALRQAIADGLPAQLRTPFDPARSRLVVADGRLKLFVGGGPLDSWWQEAQEWLTAAAGRLGLRGVLATERR